MELLRDNVNLLLYRHGVNIAGHRRNIVQVVSHSILTMRFHSALQELTNLGFWECMQKSYIIYLEETKRHTGHFPVRMRRAGS